MERLERISARSHEEEGSTIAHLHPAHEKLNMLQPRMIKDELEAAYKLMAEDEERETEALVWAEALFGDGEKLTEEKCDQLILIHQSDC